MNVQVVCMVTSPKTIPNATRGARVGGFVVGVFYSAFATGVYLTQSDEFSMWISGSCLFIGAFVAIRPWWLSVTMIEDGFVVTSWFRKYRFRRGEVESIDIRKIYSLGFGAIAVGYMPFIGAVRMIEVVANSGKSTWLPCLLGRRNAVLRLARQLRVQVGLSSAHSLSND